MGEVEQRSVNAKIRWWRHGEGIKHASKKFHCKEAVNCMKNKLVNSVKDEENPSAWH